MKWLTFLNQCNLILPAEKRCCRNNWFWKRRLWLISGPRLYYTLGSSFMRHFISCHSCKHSHHSWIRSLMSRERSHLQLVWSQQVQQLPKAEGEHKKPEQEALQPVSPAQDAQKGSCLSCYCWGASRPKESHALSTFLKGKQHEVTFFWYLKENWPILLNESDF